MAFLKKRHVAIIWLSCLSVPATITYCAWNLLVDQTPKPMESSINGNAAADKIAILEISLKKTHEQLEEARKTIEYNKEKYNSYVLRTRNRLMETYNIENEIRTKNEELNKYKSNIDAKNAETIRLKRRIIRLNHLLMVERSKKYSNSN